MNVGDELPSCSIQATGGLEAHLNDYRGQWLILYFYPKDATPGCTKEGQDFRDNYQTFQSLNTIIFGISRDNLKSHERFKTKQAFPFELISDTDEILCQQFAVIKMKSMYGKQVRGIERSTFLFDPRGKLRHIWRKVNVKEHVHDVLDTLKSLQAG
ncbi:peroxiredoxin [Legionella nagasakiensis]|uniref:peroxiredoxin n=1 Tax=Legionella nagasakiensis TaxID=535290 RepID=UPI0010565745|nr:peroxiredoxin [Legionella nagasakiensis]